ncbi:glycosyltransferase family 4 protein [Candidatus Parvarchaeota archaeon]|nr:glycosyltransferase family 4 protein [Candidatus Parvarchaeota archaeon]
MKIVFFTDTYLPNVDGVVSSIVETRKTLEGLGHTVSIMSSGSTLDAKANPDGNVCYFKSVPFIPYPSYKVAIFPFGAPSAARRFSPQLLHCHALATMGLAALHTKGELGLPSVATFHTLVTDATHYISSSRHVRSITERAIWAYLKWFFPSFDVATCPSRFAQSRLASHGIKATVVPNGVDTDFFIPLKRKNPAAAGLRGKKVALYVGRVVREKNLELLIGAAKILSRESKDAAILICGKGPALHYYMGQVQRLGLSGVVKFMGYVPRNRIVGLYNSADCFVQPSKFETQGLSVLEALSCGIPACVLEGFATSEAVVDRENGFLFEDRPQSAAQAIIEALDCKNPSRVSKAARHSALQFSSKKCAKKLLEVYGQAIMLHKR